MAPISLVSSWRSAPPRLPGGIFSEATGITGSGGVIHAGDAADLAVHAFVWTPAPGFRDLGSVSTVGDLYDLGRVVGSRGFPDEEHAAPWRGARLAQPVPLGGEHLEELAPALAPRQRRPR